MGDYYGNNIFFQYLCNAQLALRVIGDKGINENRSLFLFDFYKTMTVIDTFNHMCMKKK